MCGDRRCHYDDEFTDEFMRAVVGAIHKVPAKSSSRETFGISYDFGA